MKISHYNPNQKATPIHITNQAIERIGALLKLESDTQLKFRIYITGGGCSGFSYGFMFDRDTNDDDITLETNQCPIVIDSMSYPYLKGATLDYKVDLNGAKFYVENPNATSTCSCGSSFVI